MKSILLISIILWPILSYSNECNVIKHGALDIDHIAEASGLAISQHSPNQLYHINDSGDGPFLYVTDQNGSNVRKITIENFQPKDVEDLALGSCIDSNESCLYIADIGDNWTLRNHIKIIVVPEPSLEAKILKPQRIITIRYPDDAHNAEGLAVHPNGDVFILTKEYHEFTRKVKDSKLYYLSRDSLTQEKPIHTLQYVTTLPFTFWQSDIKDRWSKLPTALDISHDGSTFLALTYNHAFEINIDLSQLKKAYDRSIPEEKIKRISLIRLPQQEAIAYQPNSKNFLYTTEGKDSNKTGLAQIMQYQCNK